MIHQCYFRADQRDHLFSHAPYQPFGLELQVNETLIERCPELKDAAARLALVEYAAMLYHWRDCAADQDDWIGFTSYRQLAKSQFVFRDKSDVVAGLTHSDVLSWGIWDASRMQLAWLRGAAAQAEIASPMLHQFTLDVLAYFGVKLPAAYLAGHCIPLANYWALRRDQFARYMNWSWPIVCHALTLEHPYKRATPILPTIDQRKAVGYFAERLFAIWAIREGLSIAPMGDVTVG